LLTCGELFVGEAFDLIESQPTKMLERALGGAHLGLLLKVGKRRPDDLPIGAGFRIGTP
jgi:hypothetical protein